MSSPISDKGRGFLTLSIIRDLLLILLAVVVAWKFLRAEVSINLLDFSFNDFLALVLALFSVALSVAFYFKANDASNQFYDNTYKFTKDMSEILGRIEAGFGEKLKHLDEGYSGVRDRLDKLPNYGGATVSEIKEEKEEIQRKEDEQRALIEGLAQKAQLAEHEKRALFEKLSSTSKALEQARVDLEMHQRQASPENDIDRYIRKNLMAYVAKAMVKDSSKEEISSNINLGSSLRKFFSENKSKLADRALKDMDKLGLLDDNGELTREALSLLRFNIKQII